MVRLAAGSAAAAAAAASLLIGGAVAVGGLKGDGPRCTSGGGGGGANRRGRVELDTVVRTLAGRLPACFDRCALVGSAAEMNGKGRGAEIDGHDTVIRVNRLPSPGYYRDFGRRTDVYFAEPGMRMLRTESFTTVFLGAADFGGTPAACGIATGLMQDVDPTVMVQSLGVIGWLRNRLPTWLVGVGAQRCPFGGVVFKGTDRERYNLSWAERFPEDAPGASFQEAALPMAHQRSAINGAAKVFLGGEAKEPTSGIQALLTFAPVCGSLTLYGFVGNGTGDGHEITDSHDLGLEHSLIGLVADGVLPEDPRIEDRPLSTEAFGWLRESLTDLALNGGLRVVPSSSL